MQLGCPKARLAFAGRWVPKESVEDYAQESRAAVLRNIEDIMVSFKKGWRPDESLTLHRMVDRGVARESMEDFVNYDPLRMDGGAREKETRLRRRGRFQHRRRASPSRRKG